MKIVAVVLFVVVADSTINTFENHYWLTHGEASVKSEEYTEKSLKCPKIQKQRKWRNIKFVTCYEFIRDIILKS